MFTHLIIIQHLISRNTHTMEQIIKSYFINQQVIKNIRKTLHSIRPAGGLSLTRVIECGVAVHSPTLANPCLLNTHAINVRPQACCNILNFFNGKAKKKTFGSQQGLLNYQQEKMEWRPVNSIVPQGTLLWFVAFKGVMRSVCETWCWRGSRGAFWGLGMTHF